MNEAFIYDEKTSILYAPDGTPLKRVHCPRAVHWNQLRLKDAQERWRGCDHCEERVINLDVIEVRDAIATIRQHGPNTCVHGSSESGRVIYLKDPDAIRPSADTRIDDQGRTVIQTARNIFDINRAVNLGYWPDVRLVVYDTAALRTKISIGRHSETGHIMESGDYRFSFRRADGKRGSEGAIASLAERDNDCELPEFLHKQPKADHWLEAVPFTEYYPYFQSLPVAAYLIPKALPEGARLLIEDPIEDFVGDTWNQGSAYRAMSIPGRLEGRAVVLDTDQPREVSRFVG